MSGTQSAQARPLSPFILKGVCVWGGGGGGGGGSLVCGEGAVMFAKSTENTSLNCPIRFCNSISSPFVSSFEIPTPTEPGNSKTFKFAKPC